MITVICEMIGGPADGQCVDATDEAHIVIVPNPQPGERHVYRHQWDASVGDYAYVYQGVQFRGYGR